MRQGNLQALLSYEPYPAERDHMIFLERFQIWHFELPIKKIIIISMLQFVLPHSHGSVSIADHIDLKILHKQCTFAYKDSEKTLTFLYQFNGNLPPIKETKIKYLRSRILETKDRSITAEVTKRTWRELYADGDYIQLKLDDDSKRLIDRLEWLKKNFSPEKDREVILAHPGKDVDMKYQNLDDPYYRLKLLLVLQSDLSKLIDEIESAKESFLVQKQEHRLENSVPKSTEDWFWTRHLAKNALNDIIKCNLNYLSYARLIREKN
jgi:hypothetical protein